MQLPDGAVLRVTHVGTTHARRIRRHRLQLFGHIFRRFAQADGVVIGLGHLLTVQPRHFGSFGQQGRRFNQNGLARAHQPTPEGFLIARIQHIGTGQKSFGLGEHFAVAILLIALTQFFIGLGGRSELLECSDDFLFKLGRAAVEMVKATCHFTGQFDMRHLIFTDRDMLGVIHQNIGRLQQRIAQETIGRQIFMRQLFLLVLVGRHTLQPAQWRHHR